MPSGWMHAIIDLTAFDQPHLDIHQWKDEPSQWLGIQHRTERHDWYNAGKAGVWSLDRPSPTWLDESIRALGEAHGDEAAERFMVQLSHDHWDLFWDECSRRDRLLIEGFFAWALLRADILLAKFGIDVVRGRIQREIDGVLRWENHRSVLKPYRALRRYVERVLANNATLRAVVAAYETQERGSPIARIKFRS